MTTTDTLALHVAEALSRLMGPHCSCSYSSCQRQRRRWNRSNNRGILRNLLLKRARSVQFERHPTSKPFVGTAANAVPEDLLRQGNICEPIGPRPAKGGQVPLPVAVASGLQVPASCPNIDSRSIQVENGPGGGHTAALGEGSSLSVAKLCGITVGVSSSSSNHNKGNNGPDNRVGCEVPAGPSICTKSNKVDGGSATASRVETSRGISLPGGATAAQASPIEIIGQVLSSKPLAGSILHWQLPTPVYYFIQSVSIFPLPA